MFKELYCRSSASKDAEMLRILRIRAWIIHTCFNCTRIWYWMDGRSHWLTETVSCYDEMTNGENLVDLENSDCLPIDFNTEVVNEIRPVVKNLCMTIIVLSAILDLGIIKWRGLTSAIIYIEGLY